MRTAMGSARSILDQRVFGRRIRAHIISAAFICVAVVVYILLASTARAQSDLKWKRTSTPTSFSTTQAYEASRSNSQPANVRSGSVNRVQYEEIDLGKSAPVQTIQPGARPSTSRSVSIQLPAPSNSPATVKPNDVFDPKYPEVNHSSNQPKSVMQNGPSSNSSPMTPASPMQIEELPHGNQMHPEHIQAPTEHYQDDVQYGSSEGDWQDYGYEGGYEGYDPNYGPRGRHRLFRRGCNDCERAGCGEGLLDCLLGDYQCPDDSCCGEGDCGCDQCGGCGDGCGCEQGCGECGDCGCYTGNGARHPMLYGIRRFVRSTLLCVVGGCDPCDEGTFGCGPTPECTWDRDLSIYGGVEAFRGGLDRGRSGNFGYHEGVNWGMQLWRGVGFQVGGNFTQTNLNENNAGVLQRNQTFLTGGIFRRQMNYCGWQYGAVYDQLYDDFTQNIEVAQARGELSYVYGKAELGFSFAKNQKTDTIRALTFTTLDQYKLFLRRKLFLNGEGRLWVGMTENSGTLTGGEFRMAMNDSMAIQTSVNYYSPKDNDTTTLEGWNIGISLVWYPGMSACATGKSQYRPLFNVADNGSMMLRTE